MRVVLLHLVLLLLWGQAAGQSVQPTEIRVRGVELHYIEQGQGEPLILLHGGQGDYRSWGPQMKALAPQFRVISYSRRYNYPNKNPLAAKYHSAYTEADDLAAFIRKLKLGRVHLVGTSIGAFTALVLAVKHPEMVRSLVLAEPPVHQWVRDTPTGAASYREFMTTIQEPARAAFKAGDDKGAMRIFVDGIIGAGRFDNLPPEGLAAVMQNSRFFKANSLSSDPFPNLSKDKVKQLRIPVLIVSGENTIGIHKLVNEELGRLLPKAEQAIIPNAGHGSPRENPQAFNEAVLRFLAIPSQQAANASSDSNDSIFQSYEFPSHPDLTHLCQQRVYTSKGHEITWDAFASSAKPSKLVDYYHQKLGDAGFTRDGEGGLWRRPADAPRPERVLDIKAIETDTLSRQCDKKPPANSRAIIILSRMFKR